MNKILGVDFSAISHATFHISLANRYNETEDDVLNFWRHTLLSSILKRKSIIKPDEVVLCLDNGSWRNKEFEYYKARRKQRKAESSIDYTFFNEASQQFISEMKQYFPWKIISEKGCEGDDLLAILANELSVDNEFVMLTSDKDIMQLTKLDNVSYYSYRENQYKSVDDPNEFLLRLILGGDADDDIPNCHSPDNCFVAKIRQTACGTKKIEEILQTGIDEYFIDNPEYKGYYKRNKKMIELSERTIPEKLWKSVLNQYNQYEAVKPNFMNILKFLNKHKLVKLKKKIQQFY